MAKRRWSPVPIRLVDDERFLDLSVQASDLLLRLYSWGCDSHGRFPANKRSLRRRTGVEYDTIQPLKEISKAGLAKLYESEGLMFGVLVEYDCDIPANLIAKRGSPEYPELVTEHKKVPSSTPKEPQGETKGSLTLPLNKNKNKNKNNKERDTHEGDGRGEIKVIKPNIPTVDMVRDECRDSAVLWLKELDLQRKTERRGKGVKNRGVLAGMDTWETLATQFADYLAKLADADPAAFNKGVNGMIDGGKGWIMNPLKYLQGACRIAGENKKRKKGRKTERRVGPQAENTVVEKKDVKDYSQDTLEFLGVE